MIKGFFHRASRFRRAEDGNATIEFALNFPAMLFLLCFGIELAFAKLQQATLERALEIVVRDIRQGTGNAPQHDEIKDRICAESAFTDNCSTNLRLEMVELDPRN